MGRFRNEFACNRRGVKRLRWNPVCAGVDCAILQVQEFFPEHFHSNRHHALSRTPDCGRRSRLRVATIDRDACGGHLLLRLVLPGVSQARQRQQWQGRAVRVAIRMRRRARFDGRRPEHARLRSRLLLPAALPIRGRPRRSARGASVSRISAAVHSSSAHTELRCRQQAPRGTSTHGARRSRA
jgi:hypothetical protein